MPPQLSVIRRSKTVINARPKESKLNLGLIPCMGSFILLGSNLTYLENSSIPRIANMKWNRQRRIPKLIISNICLVFIWDSSEGSLLSLLSWFHLLISLSIRKARTTEIEVRIVESIKRYVLIRFYVLFLWAEKAKPIAMMPNIIRIKSILRNMLLKNFSFGRAK